MRHQRKWHIGGNSRLVLNLDSQASLSPHGNDVRADIRLAAKLADRLSNTPLPAARPGQVILNLAATSLRQDCESTVLDYTYFERGSTGQAGSSAGEKSCRAPSA